MARSKRAVSKKTRQYNEGPHWGVTSVPGYLSNGNDTTWYLVFGRTRRREEMGKGKVGMQKALREVERRNAAARARAR
jgi:hypothetical protein